MDWRPEDGVRLLPRRMAGRGAQHPVRCVQKELTCACVLGSQVQCELLPSTHILVCFAVCATVTVQQAGRVHTPCPESPAKDRPGGPGPPASVQIMLSKSLRVCLE